MASLKESFHIAQNLLQNIILEKLMAQITNKIICQTLNKKVSLTKIKQTTKKLLPKIIETVNINLQNCPKTQFVEDQIPQNSIQRSKRKFTSSCQHFNTHTQTDSEDKFYTHNSWLQSYRESKRQNQQFHRNYESHSCPTQINGDKSNYFKNSDRFFRNNHSYTEKHSSSHTDYKENFKKFQKSESKLIKLRIQNEKQDEFILRKRQNLLRKKIIQKKLQNVSEPQKKQKIQLVTTKLQKLASPTFHPFTTDYNGQLIKFKNSFYNDKSFLKKQIFTQDKLLKKKYATTTNSPQKVENFNSTKSNLKRKRAENQDESLLKQNSNIKVKIKTIFEQISVKSTKATNFQVIHNKRLKQIDRNSSDDFQANDQCLKIRSTNRFKTLKFLHNPLDQQSILKYIKLSPGVTIENHNQFQNEKQNDDFIEMNTTKSIGKLLIKSTKSIFCDLASGTMKNIMISKNLIKNESKLKKVHQKHPKFAEIHNQLY